MWNVTLLVQCEMKMFKARFGLVFFTLKNLPYSTVRCDYSVIRQQQGETKHKTERILSSI